MWLFGVGVAVLVLGGMLSLAAGRNAKAASAIAACGAIGGSLLAAAGAVQVLWLGHAVRAVLPWQIPFGNATLGLDALSAVFVLPIGLVVAAAALYGAEYLKSSHAATGVGVSWFFFNLLAASMLLVVAARNGLVFLICWESMSLASFFLVISEHDRREVRHAGWVYLVAMHLATTCLLAMFLLLGRQSGSLDFDRFSIEPAIAGVLFVLAAVGFGTKAGFIPLHVWLPEAHPAAPSHVSAVMSGVMIKTGIYGLLRTLSFLGEMPAWWGWTLVLIGVSSGVLGVLFALAQHDLKRLLAYHSVENIGIIALGLGVGMLGVSYGNPAMAFLGFLGAILHVINHAMFKSLLFLGAGAVAHATGTRDMDRLGGLLKRMPVTGGAFLVGACAICGLPPLNGFVSELLIYLGVLVGVVERDGSAGGGWASLCVLGIGGLALIGGLAAACFTKAFGSVFLGEPRSEEARRGHEAGLAMRISMVGLAAACLLIALAAPVWPAALRAAVAAVAPGFFADLSQATISRAAVPLAFACAAAWALLGIVAALALARRRLLWGRSVRRAPTWDCGYAAPTPRMQYTASSFASPLVILFRMLLRPKIELHPPQGVFPKEARFESHTPDVFYDALYRPLFAAVAWAAMKLRWVQQGRIQLYVLYIALTILALLIWKLG
jgi:formate hydrogenlyase subunit 3/multisubunit Na+/H+ antiporter MnhD subunit